MAAAPWAGRAGAGGPGGGSTRASRPVPARCVAESLLFCHDMDCGVITSKTVLLLLSLSFWVPRLGGLFWGGPGWVVGRPRVLGARGRF